MLVTMVVIPYVKNGIVAVTVSFHCKGMMRITIMVLMTLLQYINICIIFGNNGSPASYGGNDAGNDAGLR